MKPKLPGIASVLVLGTFVCVGKADDAASLRIPQLRETPEQREARLQWFRDAKFGMFVHWGPAATGGVKAERRLDVPNLGYWTNPKGTVSWPIGIASPGRYAVQAEAASPYSGVRFTVAVGHRTVMGEAPNTGSHDNYVEVDLGTAEFPNVEKVVVRVTAAEPDRWRPINLRNVKLIPSHSSSSVV